MYARQRECKKDEKCASALFEHKKIDKCTLAARLKALRKECALTQEDVADKTCVHLKHIKALEEGRFDDLPAPVYVRGFLRTIAPVLGVHPKHLVTLYTRELGIKKNVGKAKSVHDNDSARPYVVKRVHLYRALFTKRQIISIVSVLFALGGALYLFTVLRSFIGAPLVVVATPANGAVVNEPEIVVSGTTDPSATLSISGEDVIVGQDGHFETRVFLQEGVNDVVVRAKNRFDKVTEKSISVRYANPEPPQPSPTQTHLPDTVKLFVRVEGARTWLKIIVDGKEILAKTVESGFNDVFEGKEISVTSSDGARTMVSRDGEHFAPLAKITGLVKDVRFTVNDSNNAQEAQFSTVDVDEKSGDDKSVTDAEDVMQEKKETNKETSNKDVVE